MRERYNILIVSYVFPPFPGIGGRRWAKFAKYLHRKGHNVYVVAAKNPFPIKSTFLKDIQEIPPGRLIYFHPLYPEIFLRVKANFSDAVYSKKCAGIKAFQQKLVVLDKIKYHFWKRILQFLIKGNFYDRTNLWSRFWKGKIMDVIVKNEIDVVIYSGPDFHGAYELATKIKKFTKAKFIVDYRDEWTYSDFHGFGSLTTERKNIEVQKEKFVCENADLITSFAREILEFLKKHYNVRRVALLPHGFDKDDFKGIILNKKVGGESISFGYFGNIEEGYHKFFEELNKAMSVLRQQNPELYQSVRFNFFLLSEFKYMDLIEEHISRFNFNFNLPSERLFKEIAKTDYLLLLADVRSGNYFTSRVPEMLYLRKPIVLYGKKGMVSEFIEKHRIGIHLPEENFYETFLNILKGSYSFSFDTLNVDEFDYSVITDKLIEFIAEIKNA